MRQIPDIAPGNDPEEYVLDGVRYANVRQGDQLWHIGSITPTWRQELLSLPPNPERESIARLETRGLWLSPAGTPCPPLAVMCCGLGSVWPGMGRELYDNFPVARAAMDRIAAVANWDILGLMDERDAEKINHTRWQCPYLFMLEFAQWNLLQSLGLAPTLICGHSLGELIGLCFAGVYTPEVAWYILDTRAVHMAELETTATRETGMMAVHGSAEVICETRKNWPSLYVSNYNTPQQFILSGPREMLLEARRHLRKRHIPAIVLNVSLAFHHPGMRVLRDLSLRRLNALAMHAPKFPMLSCITTGFYPEDQPNICRYIADLDENAVRWTECVQAMWKRDGIRVFLELGPQETLCSLVADNQSDACCFSAGRKGHEVESLRSTCARLYSKGYLHSPAASRRIFVSTHGLDLQPPAPHHSPLPPDGAEILHTKVSLPPKIPVVPPVNASDSDNTKIIPSHPSTAHCLAIVTAAIARACERPIDELRPEMDLRYDLALRSSRFPLIVQDVEKALGCSINFDQLLQVSTIGDFARILSGDSAIASSAMHNNPLPAQTEKGFTHPLVRYAPLTGLPLNNEKPIVLLPLSHNSYGQGLSLHKESVLAVWGPDAHLLRQLLRGLAPLGCKIGIPAAFLDACQPLAELGARLIPLDMPLTPHEALTTASATINSLSKINGRLDGILFAVPLVGAEDATSSQEKASADLLQTLVQEGFTYGLQFVCSCTVLPPAGDNCVFDGPLAKALETKIPSNLDIRSIRLLHGGEPCDLEEWGDMLAQELMYGTTARVIWARPGELSGNVFAPIPKPQYQHGPPASCFPPMFMDPAPPYNVTASLTQTCCHFSRFADPVLNDHGGCKGEYLDRSDPWLPASYALTVLLEGARSVLPWLQPTGFCDIRFHHVPTLPPGITRECRLAVEAEQWLTQDGTMTRMCRGRLSVRQLTPNGRHTQDYAQVMDGMAWLAPKGAMVPPLWMHTPVSPTPITIDPTLFYAAAGLGSTWRLVRSFTPLSDDMFTVTLCLSETAIAPRNNYSYNNYLCVVEGILQAGMLALTFRDSNAFADAVAIATLIKLWNLNGIGFIRFGTCRATGPVHLLLRRSWNDGHLLRFDAQAVDCRQNVFLTVHHIEFSKRDHEKWRTTFV